MKRFYVSYGFIFLVFMLLSVAPNANGQNTKETYTGTVLYFGSGLDSRTVTQQFTLTISGQTSDEQAQRYLNLLRESGQSKVLDAIRGNELGRFSVGANVGVPVNVVRERTINGQRRIFVVFERWTQFAELRGGYRSLDYPFGVIELYIDERTGKGEGTYIAAAKIRWDEDKNNNYQVEIENFATFPARLMGVQQRNFRGR